jgi:hypothetical protein
MMEWTHMACSIKTHLAHARDLNPDLAFELKKLPELNTPVLESACEALGNVLDIYQFAPDRFDHMLERMCDTGLSEHRNYCSPFQAFFWLVQDEKLTASGTLLGLDIVAYTDAYGGCRPRLGYTQDASYDTAVSDGSGPHYTLTNVLDAAWNGETELMMASKIRQIIQRIQFREESEEYELLAKRHGNRELQGYIMDDFLTKRHMFHQNDWETIEDALEQSRWKSFYSVADRLNAPELVSYYINKSFMFRKSPANGVYFSFFNQEAQCTDAAYFAEFMLRRSGYRTFMRSVKWDDDPWDGLHTGAGIILDDGRYLLVSNFTGINAMSGPFLELDQMDEKMSCGRKIIDRKWGVYYPPRYY